jgi:hypothetical protein
MCQDGDASPEPVRISIVQHFEALPDPREGPNAVHKLIDIIVIAVCAVIAGCEACTQMAEYGRRKESWLRQFLELPRGIPSHDTFSRVLALLDATKCQECFMRWAAALLISSNCKINHRPRRRAISRPLGMRLYRATSIVKVPCPCVMLRRSVE